MGCTVAAEAINRRRHLPHEEIGACCKGDRQVIAQRLGTHPFPPYRPHVPAPASPAPEVNENECGGHTGGCFFTQKCGKKHMPTRTPCQRGRFVGLFSLSNPCVGKKTSNAKRSQRLARISARPTVLATASVCSGCTAKRRPVTTATARLFKSRWAKTATQYADQPIQDHIGQMKGPRRTRRYRLIGKIGPNRQGTIQHVHLPAVSGL